MRLHVEDESAGPAVVLLHGFPLDGRMWAQQCDALVAAGFRVVVPDLRGFGRSPPAASATMDEMAGDVLETLDALRIGHCAVAGFSMGGYVALAMADQAPDRVTGLALVDSRTAADTDAQKEGRGAAIEAVRADPAAFAAGMAPKLLASEDHADTARAWMTEQSAEGVIAALGGMRDRPDRTATWRGLDVPRLVVVGADDQVTPPEEAQGLAVPGVELVEVPGGHLTPLEAPVEVSKALIAWATRSTGD